MATGKLQSMEPTMATRTVSKKMEFPRVRRDERYGDEDDGFNGALDFIYLLGRNNDGCCGGIDVVVGSTDGIKAQGWYPSGTHAWPRVGELDAGMLVLGGEIPVTKRQQ
jgi:hypothetical protein